MREKRYLGFQAKITIPVVAFLVLVLATSTWIVNRRVKAQLRQEAIRNLGTAEAVFHNSLEIRSRNLILRYQNIVNEPRFRAVAQLAEPMTMETQLNELLGEMGPDVEAILFTTADRTFLAGVTRNSKTSIPEFVKAGQRGILNALKGGPVSDNIAVAKHLYNIICVPAIINKTLLGVLTVGIRLNETAAGEIKSLIGSEIVFLADGQVVASTLRDPNLYQRMGDLFHQLLLKKQNGGAEKTEEWITPEGEHFICVADTFGSNSSNQLGYILLSSVQKSLQATRDTTRTLWLLTLSGLLISSILIAFLIRKITLPLRELRNSAEAVGRGDFSKRLEIPSNDECGELAQVFNQMTERLTASRVQTEKALESLKNTQEQLVQSEKLSGIGEFVAGVAHELNNPLTAVIGFSEMLEESNIGERERKCVQRIIESADRSHKIVQNLLSFARQHPPERKWVIINRLIDAAVEIISYEMRTSNINVIKELSTEVPPLWIDPHQMQQVFLNITNNARHAIENHRESGTIRISTEVLAQHVRITFQDDGPGIPAENLTRIFDPFFTTKPVGEGTGLGLSLSYGIIQEHKGSITAHSRLGEGTTFIIELPLSQLGEGASDTRIDSARIPAVSQETKGEKILIIDDEEAILDVLQQFLSSRGYRVDTATNGESALKCFQRDHYDLVVCDWKIPGLSGQQIYEKLREMKPDSAGRFIFMTGDLLNPKNQQFLQEQQTPCLSKPFSKDELFITVDKVLHPL